MASAIPLALASALTCLLSSTPSHAKGAGKHSVGVTGGLAFPDTSSSIFTFGVNSFFQVWHGLGVGLFYQRYGIDASLASDAGESTLRSSTVYYGIEPQYTFSGTLDGFTAGLRSGFALSSKEAYSRDLSSGSFIVISDSSNQFFLAPKIAYDYPVGRFTLGAEASYVIGMGDDAPRATMFQIAVKFWF